MLIDSIKGYAVGVLAPLLRREVGVRDLDAPRKRKSISRIALFLPRIAVHVIAAQLPEAGFVTLGELQSLDPFRRFPEVKVWHQQPGGTAVLGGLLQRQEALVIAAHRAQGLALRGRVVIDGWSTLVLDAGWYAGQTGGSQR